MIRQFIKTSKGLKIGVGLEYILILGLGLLLAQCSYPLLVKWDNNVAVALIAIALFFIGNSLSQKEDPKVAFAGQVIALVPLASAIRVILPAGAPEQVFMRALLFVGIGLAVTTALFVFDFNPFKHKSGSLGKIVAVFAGCYIIAIVFKWIEFNIFELLIIVILGFLYAYCWREAQFVSRTPRGLVKAGCLVFRVPLGIPERVKARAQGH